MAATSNCGNPDGTVGHRRLRSADWAAEIGVSRVTFWHWIAHLGLKASRIGRITIVDERDLNAFLARHVVKPHAKVLA